MGAELRVPSQDTWGAAGFPSPLAWVLWSRADSTGLGACLLPGLLARTLPAPGEELRPSPRGCKECHDRHPSPEQGRRISPGICLIAGFNAAVRRAQKSPTWEQGWDGSPALQIKGLSPRPEPKSNTNPPKDVRGPEESKEE